MLPFLLFAQLRVPPALTLFPYTTLFRSFPLMDEGDPDALLSEQVGGVQGQSLLEFGDRVVEEADVVVDHPELVVRVLQARVERQRTAILLDRQNMRESVGGAPQDVRPRVVRFGEIG